MSDSPQPAPHKLHKPAHVLVGFAVVGVLASLALWQKWLQPRYVFGLILAVTLGVLALEKLNKVILVLLGAGLALFLGVWQGLIPLGHGGGHSLPPYIAMIDWGTIGIIIGSTVFVELVSRSGLFTWFSIKILKLSGGDPMRLLVWFSLLTVLFSAFLNNVTAMIIVGSLTVVSCRKLKLDPLPFLLGEGIFTNIGGLLTLISSIPNIIVGTEAGISYGRFFVVAAPYCLVTFFATIWLLRRLFGLKPLGSDEERAKAREMVERFDEWDTVRDRGFFKISAFVLVGIILMFALHAQIPVLHELGLEVVAFIGATLMLVLYPTDVEEVLDRVEWSLVFFFVGLFALIGVMEHAGVLEMLAEWLKGPLGSGEYGGPLTMLWASALFSGLTDNIPLSAVLAKVLSGYSFDYQMLLWWALIFGAGLGGNVTPIGSASTVVALTILRKEGKVVTFLGYVKIGGLVVLVQLLLATAYLFLAYTIGFIG